MNPAISSTDSAGSASTRWTPGTTAGSNHATATVAGLAPVTVNATAVAGNAIARVTVTSPTSTPHEGETVQLTAILARWRSAARTSCSTRPPTAASPPTCWTGRRASMRPGTGQVIRGSCVDERRSAQTLDAGARAIPLGPRGVAAGQEPRWPVARAAHQRVASASGACARAGRAAGDAESAVGTTAGPASWSHAGFRSWLQYLEPFRIDCNAAGRLAGIDIDEASKRVQLDRLVLSHLPSAVETPAA